MDTNLFATFFFFSGLITLVLSQSCEPSHYERCLQQLLQFTEKGDLLFASSETQLQQECVQAQSALGCLTRYARKCLPLDDRPRFLDGISGPQKMTTGLCTEESGLSIRYMQSLPCLKNASDGLQYCRDKYDRNQRDIILVEYEDKTHLKCCSFDGYRRCLRMLMETHQDCREGPADVIDEIALMFGGTLSEDTCTEYFDRCTGGGAASIQTKLSLILAILAPMASVLLPFMSKIFAFM